MTPKEKAENMYNNYSIDIKFTMEDCSWTYRGNNYELCVKKTAKQCALIAVEYMLKESVLPIISHRTDSYKTAEDFNKNFNHIKDQIDSFIISKYSYWQQVKHEIEKL